MTSPLFYGTASGFTTYHTARNVDVSAFTDTNAITAKLVVASEWLDGKYRYQFPGFKVGYREQIREWPRVGGIDIHGYSIDSATNPTEVENSTYEAALRELTNPGVLSVDYTPPKYVQASVDGAVRVEYNLFNQATDVQIQLQIVNQILAPILTGGLSSPLSGGSGRA